MRVVVSLVFWLLRGAFSFSLYVALVGCQPKSGLDFRSTAAPIVVPLSLLWMACFVVVAFSIITRTLVLVVIIEAIPIPLLYERIVPTPLSLGIRSYSFDPRGFPLLLLLHPRTHFEHGGTADVTRGNIEDVKELVCVHGNLFGLCGTTVGTGTQYGGDGKDVDQVGTVFHHVIQNTPGLDGSLIIIVTTRSTSTTTIRHHHRGLLGQ